VRPGRYFIRAGPALGKKLKKGHGADSSKPAEIIDFPDVFRLTARSSSNRAGTGDVMPRVWFVA
jgi:hypothetical protein